MHHAYGNRQKHKKRKTFASFAELDETPHYIPHVKRKSYPSVEGGNPYEDVSEKYVIKEYYGNHLKTEIFVSKHNKIHPMFEPEVFDQPEPPDQVPVVSINWGLLSKKIICILYYFGIISCIAI